MSKELIAATVRELDDWPGASMVQEPQGKHCKVVLRFADQSRLVVVGSTPSDHRALPNHLAVVRRELRAMGAQKAHIIVGKPKERPFKPHVPAVQKPFETLEEIIVSQPSKTADQKFKHILTAIADLRYGEMLQFAEALSGAAIDTKMQRNRPHDWARMLQALIEAETELAA